MQHPGKEVMVDLLSLADILVWAMIFLPHLSSVKSMFLNNFVFHSKPTNSTGINTN